MIWVLGACLILMLLGAGSWYWMFCSLRELQKNNEVLAESLWFYARDSSYVPDEKTGKIAVLYDAGASAKYWYTRYRDNKVIRT